MTFDPQVNPADLPDFPEMDPTGTVELAQIECNLNLTPLERLRQHDRFLEFFRAARRAFI